MNMALDFEIDDETHLRSLILEDAQDLFALVDANRPYLRRWLNWVDTTISVNDIRGFIQNALDQAANDCGPVCCITDASTLVGICGFKPIDKTTRSTELGYWLAESVAGRGIMTHCVSALIGYAFRELQVNRIELRAAEENSRSRAVAQRLGFTQEGVLRDSEWLNDHYVNQTVYSLLKREWDSEQDGAEQAPIDAKSK
jgi:ribosomal-protein-serine acetyltransferase